MAHAAAPSGARADSAAKTSPPLASAAKRCRFRGRLGRSPPVEKRYETITEWSQLERWIELLRSAELFAFETETTSRDYMKAEIVGVSFAIEPGVAAYVPLTPRLRRRAGATRSRASARTR